MNKKLIIVIAIIIIVALSIGYFIFNNKSEKKETNTTVNESNNNKPDDQTIPLKGKALVVYFSASGSTKKVANQIAEYLNADLFEIVPEEVYTSQDLNWNNENSRVSKEHNDKSLRNIKLKNTKVDNWDSYDTVLIGYPIWWGESAWPVNTFVKSNDFTNKTVIPFCTSASSGLGNSGKLLSEEANGGVWLEGHRFNSGASSSDIKTWIDSLKSE